jgi:hypothetical protein
MTSRDPAGSDEILMRCNERDTWMIYDDINISNQHSTYHYIIAPDSFRKYDSMTHMQVCDSKYVNVPFYMVDHIFRGWVQPATWQRGFHLMFHFQDFCGENMLWHLVTHQTVQTSFLDKLRCAWELCVLLSFTSMALWLQRSSALHVQMCSEVF